MTCELFAVCFAAARPLETGRFWAGLLGGEATDDAYGGVSVLIAEQPGFRIRFRPDAAPKSGPNPAHFNLTSSSLEDQERRVARALELGGRHIDVGQLPEETHVVLADPEGNEFCVVGPGNNSLAGLRPVGDVAGDGSREAGLFWSRALEWPLVWDQDEETAIQAPYGGPKLTWGGPPLMDRTGPDRVHFDLTAPDAAAIDRLIALGAARAGGETGAARAGGGKTSGGQEGGREPGFVAMTDPDGADFCVLLP